MQTPRGLQIFANFVYSQSIQCHTFVVLAQNK